MGDKVNPRITREVMQQFEIVRKCGTVNTGIMEEVYNKAVELGLDALRELLWHDFEEHPYDVRNRDYIEILRRQDFYFSKYKLTR